VASDATDHIAVSIQWGRFCDDPEMILPPGEVFDHRGMMLLFGFLFV
jgi:hypothetical protein